MFIGDVKVTKIFDKEKHKIKIIAPAGYYQNHKTAIHKIEKIFIELGLQYDINSEIFAEGLLETKYFGFANTDHARAQDFINTLLDDSVRIIWAFRGGYGTFRMWKYVEENFNAELAEYKQKLLENPEKYFKVLVGYSDLTVLHSLFNSHMPFHCPTIHADMLAAISERDEELMISQVEGTLDLINQGNCTISCSAFNDVALGQQTPISGKLLGGNLAIIASLEGTNLAVPFKDNIILLEDIGQPYVFDRDFRHLFEAGLKDAKAIIVGDFVYRGEDEETTEKWEIEGQKLLFKGWKELTGKYGVPLYYAPGIGHGAVNQSCYLGAEAKLEANELLIGNPFAGGLFEEV